MIATPKASQPRKNRAELSYFIVPRIIPRELQHKTCSLAHHCPVCSVVHPASLRWCWQTRQTPLQLLGCTSAYPWRQESSLIEMEIFWLHKTESSKCWLHEPHLLPGVCLQPGLPSFLQPLPSSQQQTLNRRKFHSLVIFCSCFLLACPLIKSILHRNVCLWDLQNKMLHSKRLPSSKNKKCAGYFNKNYP